MFRLEVLWQEEIGKRGPYLASLPNVCWRFVRTRICIAGFLLSCSTICGFISSVCLLIFVKCKFYMQYYI